MKQYRNRKTYPTPAKGGEKGARDPRMAEKSRTNPKPVIYGVLPVLEALRANPRRIEKILLIAGSNEARMSEIIKLARAAAVPVHRESREDFVRRVPPGANHQGVAAFGAAADYFTPDELFEGIEGEALLVVLDGVEDPRNLGAVLRAAECAGADGVIIPERRAAGLTDTVAKSSAGAMEYVKVAKAANINRLIADLKERGVWVVGTDANAATDYTEWDWTRASALVLGGEGSGLHRLVAENCDILVKIPMHGKINSLNVSVAAGVILFEARRQRSVGGKQEGRANNE